MRAQSVAEAGGASTVVAAMQQQDLKTLAELAEAQRAQRRAEERAQREEQQRVEAERRVEALQQGRWE